MINLPSTPRVLLLSGGPASTYLLAQGGWRRVYTVKSVSYALRDKLVEYQGDSVTPAERVHKALASTAELVLLYHLGFRTRDFGLQQAVAEICEREGAGVEIYAGRCSPVPDRVRRGIDQLTTATDYPELSGLRGPLSQIGIPRDRFVLPIPDRVIRPLKDYTLAEVRLWYRAEGLDSLWEQTHSCFFGTACTICESCRTRAWASSAVETT